MCARYRRWMMALIVTVPFMTGATFLLGLLPALIMGFALGAGWILAQQSMGRTVRTAQELSSRFGLTVLVTLPRFERVAARTGALDRALTINSAMPDSTVEAYRALGARVHGLGGHVSRKIIMVTGCFVGEGASTVAGNLARALSQTGGRVLLVDCDLRRPTLGGMFGQPNEPGLADLLAGGGRPVFRRLDGLPFDLLPAGRIPDNPLALLDSGQMKEFLEYARKHHEYVVLDMPPVLSVTDARLLAPQVDVLLAVIEPGRTRYATVRQLIETLHAVGKEIDGVVLNDRTGCATGNPRGMWGETKVRIQSFLLRRKRPLVAGAVLLTGVAAGFLWMAGYQRGTAPAGKPELSLPAVPRQDAGALPLDSARWETDSPVKVTPAEEGKRGGRRIAARPRTTSHAAPSAGLQSALAAIGRAWQKKPHAAGNATQNDIEASLAAMGLQANLLGDDLAALLQLNTPLLLEVRSGQGEKTWLAVVGRQGFNFQVSPPWQQKDWLPETELRRLWTGWGYLPLSDPLKLISLEGRQATPEQIRRLQQLLVKAGYLQHFETGVLGRETIKAVGRLQAEKGLRVNGQVTPETLALLYQFDPAFAVPRFALSH